MPNKGVIYIGDVSGNLGTINSSGQLRVEASVSIPPVNANVSGNMVYLPNDGVNNVVSISGQTVVASVNVAANVSGNTIYLVNDSVNNITKISGQLVAVSGLINARVSGSVSVSGNAIYLVNDGVNNVVSISGQTVVASVVTNISGQVVAESGNVVWPEA